MNALRQAAQKVVDERFKPGGEWDDLKNAIADMANVLDQKPSHDSTNDGGPAFPIPLNPGESWSEETQGDPNGMSLRDWFAGMALSGLIGKAYYAASQTDEPFTGISETLAVVSYGMADAMLSARKGGES